MAEKKKTDSSSKISLDEAYLEAAPASSLGSARIALSDQEFGKY